MKKVRITVNKGSAGKKIPVFNSPESLYVWLHDPDLRYSQRLDPSLGSMIMLRPGETMEVEWLGCEFIYEVDQVLRVDQIRLAKTMKVKSMSMSNVIGVHSGWIVEEIISFKSGRNEEIKRTRLTNKSKQKFNINELFISRGLDNNQDPKLEPQDIH